MSSPWTDRGALTGGQYRTDANLAARQPVYAFQRPRIELPSAVLSLARLDGTETVADIGRGNGAYLAELSGGGHTGPAGGRLVGRDAGGRAKSRPRSQAGPR